MSRDVDMGLSERRAWIRLEQYPVYTVPFTFWDVLSWVVLGALIVCVLMLW